MSMYRFADLSVEMNCTYETMKRRSEKYRTEETCAPDISILVPEKKITEPAEKYRHLPPKDIELILMCGRFSREILLHEGFVLHSSAIVYRNRGILFSADSGVGKSTHTRLWQKHFGAENVRILNDDKPAIRSGEDGFTVYGTPFSGNSDENLNLSVPLHAIVFIERDEKNFIHKISPEEAMPLLMRHTLRPGSSAERMEVLLGLLNRLLLEIPVYKLHCNMEEEAAVTAAEGLFQEE